MSGQETISAKEYQAGLAREYPQAARLGVFDQRKPRTPRRDLEHQEQVALMQIVALHENKMPELKNLFAIPNGGGRTQREGGRLKAEGVRAGVPDLQLAFPSGEFHGLFVEMKIKPNTPSKAQKDWILRLKSAGYRCEVCYSADAAWRTIKNYLKVGE